MTHGHASTHNPSPTYQSWNAMLGRCYNKNDKDYPNYGGRGIKVCDRWHNFVNFLDDMKERPEGLTIEREDVNGGYGPDNCSWATREQQARNRTNTYLSLDIAANIVIAKQQGRTYSDVARVFDVTRQQVRHICLGNAWWGAIDLANEKIALA